MSEYFHILTREERAAYALKLPSLNNSIPTACLPVIGFFGLPRAFRHQPTFLHWGWIGMLSVAFFSGLNFYRLRKLYVEMKPVAERNPEVMTTLKAAIRFHDAGNFGVMAVLYIVYIFISK